jgi:hypothetical protein
MQEDRDRIKAALWWSKELGWGTEIEATTKIYLKLIKLYKEEVFKLFAQKSIEPAILKLREMMEQDGGDLEPILAALSSVDIGGNYTRNDGGRRFDIDKGAKLYAFDFDETLAKSGENVRVPQVMFEELIKRIRAGRYIVIITGRSLDALRVKFDPVLQEALKSGEKELEDSLDKIILAGELGAAIGKYENGSLVLDRKQSRPMTSQEREYIKSYACRTLDGRGLLYKERHSLSDDLSGNEIEIRLEKYGVITLQFKNPAEIKLMPKIAEELRGNIDKRRGIYFGMNHQFIVGGWQNASKTLFLLKKSRFYINQF